MQKKFLSGERLRDSKTDGERDKEGAIDKRVKLDSDLGRLIFSPCCRRLHDKTQVFPLTSDDNIHSRLTHSLEVMSVGRTFAANLMDKEQFKVIFLPKEWNANSPEDMVKFYREIESLLSVICLAHDIGNPPFGHFGETILQNYFKNLIDSLNKDYNQHKEDENFSSPIIKGILSVISSEKKIDDNERFRKKKDFFNGLEKFLKDKKLLFDYTQFDGNAEGFRIMTKLQFLNDLYGLNLTSASLASFLKYPNFGPKDKSRICLHKHGVFSTEQAELNKVMNNCGIDKENDTAYHRHPFSYLMEASDTICYLTMDFEDAINKHWLSYTDLVGILEKNDHGKDVLKKAKKHFNEDDPDKKKIVQLRTNLINYYVEFATNRFINNINQIIDGKFNEELLNEEQDKNNLAKLIGEKCRKLIFEHKEIESLEITANAILTGIMDYYVEYLFHPEKDFRMRAKRMLSKAIFHATLQEHLGNNTKGKNAWDVFDDFDPCELTLEERLRIIRDFVSGMTDKYALSHYRRLTGQKI